MSRAGKSFFAGKSAHGKIVGYLTTVARTGNRWGIERVDVLASTCLQSKPCQHDAVLWLVSDQLARAPTNDAAELYAIARLIGVKFVRNGAKHMDEYANEYDTVKGRVAALLDEHFGPTDKVSERAAIAEAPKKRACDAETVPQKKHAGDATDPTTK